jgi:hypothetical protein
LHFIFSIAIENIFVTMLECGVSGVCLYGACVEQRFGRSVSTWAAAHVPAAAPIASSCPGTLTMTPAVTSVCVARCTGSHRAGTIEIPFCESRIVYLWPLKVHAPLLKSHSGRAAARSGCCKESRIIFIAAPSRPGLFYSACVLYGVRLELSGPAVRAVIYGLCVRAKEALLRFASQQPPSKLFPAENWH